MTQRAEIAIAALFVGVGLAGMPLEPWRIVLSLVLCAAIASIGGRFIAALAFIATIAIGFLQHHELRVSLLLAGALVGLCARFSESRPRATTTLAFLGALTGTAFLLFG